MSGTTYLVIAASTSLLLALFGFVVTFKPLTRRGAQRAAMIAFVLAGLVGVVCVWQAGVSADREQVKARAAQRSLCSEVAALKTELTKGQSAVTNELAKVSRQTAPLGTVPLPVKVTNPPQTVARQIEEPRPRESGFLRWFQKEVRPAYIDSLSAIELTIQADRELPNATIEVVCDAPILGEPQIEAAAFPACQVNGIVPIGDRTIRFTVISPTLSEGQAYKVTLESGRRSPPISVTGVRKVQ